MSKFVLTTHKETNCKCDVVRLDKEAQKIVKEFHADSGLSILKIVSECIRYAYENYEGTQAEELK